MPETRPNHCAKLSFLLCAALPTIASLTFLFPIIGSAAETAHHGAHSSTASSHGSPTIKTSVRALGPVEIGKLVPLVLTLTSSDGKPVSFDDLREIHTKKIHMLIVDPSLSDYQHEHPDATTKSNEFAFSFTPMKAGEYYFFADLLPLESNAQEYSVSKLKVPGQPSEIKKQENRSVTVVGFKFDLAFENPELMQGQGTAGTLKVSTADGQPFNQLEPVMGAFAHFVAFSEDRKNVLHVHPQGKEPETEAERGGPELNFYVNPPKSGYQQLYAQVQIGGRNVFAPFGINVKERQVPSNVEAIFKEVDTNTIKLQNAVELGQLHQVHGIAAWTRDVLLGLPKATDLKPGASEKLSPVLKRIESQAESLDHYGDAGNKEKTAEVLVQLLKSVDDIREVVGAAKVTANDSSTSAVRVLGNRNCPVSNMPVGSMESGAAIVYNGVKIGLCCSGCKSTFDKNPEEYLKKAEQDAAKK